MVIKSDFGKGLTYNLGLFLAHAERYDKKYKETDGDWPSYWFYAAGDHLFDLEIPSKFKPYLRKRIEVFQAKVISFRNSLLEKNATEDDFKWAIKEAKNLLALIDREIGVKSVIAEWD